jgi:glutamate-1-semialdehyde 2,1-aminomutase
MLFERLFKEADALALATETRDRHSARLDELIAEQERIFLKRQGRSAELDRAARGSLAGGVTSNWQIARPQPIWIERGAGSHIFDADGHELVDLHGGYGVGVVGHAHPKIVEAVSARVRRGTHFAQPTEDAIAVSRELARRWGLPLWRFSNSGTEATMDAVHLMRAATGRDLIVKLEGTYHGHHDSVMVSVMNEDPAELGPAESPNNPTFGAGIPRAIASLTLIVPFNDLEATERTFHEYDGRIAGMIVEPIMMNAGIIAPEPGYLEGVRELTRRHGILLAFDEVKTGLGVGPGGATRRYGVTPDVVSLAKAVGGGIPCGAIGGTEEVMRLIAEGGYDQVGTFNGNPLTMAAARATLCEILNDDAYRHLERLQERMVSGTTRIIEENGLEAYPQGFTAKGSVTFSPTRVRNYRDFLRVDDRYSHCHWLYQHNGGVFLPPWGKAEQWTISVQHTDRDIDRFLANFEAFARALGA